MLTSYIAKHHWLAHLQDAWIVERAGGRQRGHYVQLRGPSLLALSPYLVPFGLTVDAGALYPLVCARLSAAWVDEAMRFTVQTNLNWMIRLSRRLWYQVFLSYKLTSVMISDFFNLLQCERNIVLSFLKSICKAKNPHGLAHFHGSFRRGYSYQPTTPAL